MGKCFKKIKVRLVFPAVQLVGTQFGLAGNGIGAFNLKRAGRLVYRPGVSYNNGKRCRHTHWCGQQHCTAMGGTLCILHHNFLKPHAGMQHGSGGNGSRLFCRNIVKRLAVDALAIADHQQLRRLVRHTKLIGDGIGKIAVSQQIKHVSRSYV